MHSQNLPNYPSLKGGAYSGPENKYSPDPLASYYWNDPDQFDSLQYFTASPVTQVSNPASAVKFNKSEIIINRNCDILFDFGREYAAWPEFDSDELPAEVQMSISEYNEPAILNQGAQHPVKTLKPVRYGKTYRLELNKELYEGVRFVWIHVRKLTKPFSIKNIRLICQTMPVNYYGSFESDDTQLNKIWYTGAYTVRLNLLQHFFGAILMERSDRHSWTGDAYPAQAAALVAFGNYKAIKKNLEYTSKLDNGIPAYALYWVLSLIDYYMYTGDTLFLKSKMDIVNQHLQNAFRNFDSLPNLAFLGWDERLGAGFEKPNSPECQSVYRFLALDAWRKFAGIMEYIGNKQLAKQYQDYYLEKSRWMLSGKWVNSYGVHAISKAVNAGLIANDLVKQSAERLFSDRSNRLSYSPFNQYFIIQAMAVANQHEKALVTIKDNWGGQLDYGGTTFFEVFRPSWNRVLQKNDAPPNNQCGYTSLAHPWGAGVTKWISESILGIRPIRPGFKTFEILPFPGLTISNLKGTVPTTHGIIKAEFDLLKGRALVVVPEGIHANRVGIPLQGKNIIKSKIFRNNTLSTDISSSTDSTYLYFNELSAGSYIIDFIYATDNNKRIKEEPIKYPITEFRIDSVTHGNWYGRYGRQGYFFPAMPRQPGYVKYPSYVDSINLNLNGVKIWDTVSTDYRALQSPQKRGRWASAIITRDPLATLQTMTIDIHCNEEKLSLLSLYFLDWDSKGRRAAIEIFDLHTLNLIAPVQMIKNFEKGKYLTLAFKSSIRIRINQVRGENAALSGLFFDPLDD